MDELIISVSGLRGIVGTSLTPHVVQQYVAAFARQLPTGAEANTQPVVVSRDGRTTGRMLADIVKATLQACGRDVVDADVASTPTTGVLVRSLGAAGGVQVSASHNPPAYNGIKLFGADGRVIPAQLGEAVSAAYREGRPDWAAWDAIGAASTHADPHAAHLESVLGIVDVERIRDCRFPVLLDSNHGAGSLLGRRLLEALNCRLTLLGGTPDGKFAHKPEPTAENLVDVGREVVGCGAIIGFCQDPDADRLALIDGAGRYIGEEYTLALCMDHVLRQRRDASPDGPSSAMAVVTNCATSRMSEDIATRYGATFHRSAVGEANVADVMIREQAVFGGEGNGGPIDPRVGYVRDSFVGMALLLDALAHGDGQPAALQQWVAELPSYAIHKDKVEMPRDRVPAAMERLEAKFSAAAPSRLDGLRLDWPDRWLLLRASNTEPIVRAIAEAPTADEARELADEAMSLLRQSS
ncbi:MAG: phosphoglucosamine mutase [Planctomycetales bacterium]|nr:phosphoglucosamine mutase [Planctomycetales bacterium]